MGTCPDETLTTCSASLRAGHRRSAAWRKLPAAPPRPARYDRRSGAPTRRMAEINRPTPSSTGWGGSGSTDDDAMAARRPPHQGRPPTGARHDGTFARAYLRLVPRAGGHGRAGQTAPPRPLGHQPTARSPSATSRLPPPPPHLGGGPRRVIESVSSMTIRWARSPTSSPRLDGGPAIRVTRARRAAMVSSTISMRGASSGRAPAPA